MNNLQQLCHDYKELQRLAESVSAELDTLKELIRSEMGDNDVVTAGEYKISNKAIETARIDTTALKKALPDVAARFVKTVVSRRFVIS